jgi:hypothetical protein
MADRLGAVNPQLPGETLQFQVRSERLMTLDPRRVVTPPSFGARSL